MTDSPKPQHEYQPDEPINARIDYNSPEEREKLRLVAAAAIALQEAQDNQLSK